MAGKEKMSLFIVKPDLTEKVAEKIRKSGEIKEVQSLQSSCVLDSAPLWVGLERASLCEVTGRIMVPGRGKGEEIITKHLGLSSSLLLAKVKISIKRGELGNPWPLVIRDTKMNFLRKTSRQ